MATTLFTKLGCYCSLFQETLKASRYYSKWMYSLHPLPEQEDLRRYEQWSLAVALRKPPDSKSAASVILHCPFPDCGYAWVADAKERQAKRVHEAKHFRLCYKPPKPVPIPFDWARPEYLSLDAGLPKDFEEDEGSKDARRMVCARCHAVFCGLCRRPWRHGQSCHEGRSCKQYNRRFPSGDDEFWMVSGLQHTKSCPGCSLRTSRIDGCNHMTCPCGTEWCYVCERGWNQLHYSCVEGPARRPLSGLGCVVS